MDIEITFNPEKYGYKMCDYCNVYGSSLKEESDRCTKCGGSGLIKTEDIKEEVKSE